MAGLRFGVYSNERDAEAPGTIRKDPDEARTSERRKAEGTRDPGEQTAELNGVAAPQQEAEPKQQAATA